MVVILLGSGAQRWCCELICNYLKQLVKTKPSGQGLCSVPWTDKSSKSKWLTSIHVDPELSCVKKKHTMTEHVVKLLVLSTAMFKHADMEQTPGSHTAQQRQEADWRHRCFPIPSSPVPIPTHALNYPTSATCATSLISTNNNGGELHWPWVRFD